VLCDKSQSASRIWSLWEIMNRLKVEQVACIAAQIQILMESCNFAITFGHGAEPPHPDTIAKIPIILVSARDIFSEVGLTESLQQLELAGHYLAGSRALSALETQSELTRILETLMAESRKRWFLSVAPDRTMYIDQASLFGDLVAANFPSAGRDIREAGNCLAVECSAATVFHLMRAAEVSLRALATDRQISFANKPLDQQEWGTILGALEGILKQIRFDDLKNWPQPENKDIQLRFYNEAIQELRGFNEAWRRHVSHARDDAFYDRDYAASVLNHVRLFMQKLATKISETVVTPKYW